MLGLLYEQSLHGYEINRVIEERGIRNWANVGFSSIYYLLDKLESRGLVASNGARSKAKKTFSITAEGRKSCRTRTKDLVQVRVPNKNPFMIGLANGSLFNEATFSELLQARLDELQSQLAIVKREWKKQQPLPKPAEYLFSFSVNEISSEISWLRSVINE